MAYDETLAESVRRTLAGAGTVEEKRMMGGLTFMLNGKMCVGVLGAELMCRIDPQVEPEALKRKNARPMDFTGKPMRGFVFVSNVRGNRRELDYWLRLALDFNSRAKASRRKR